MKSEVDNTLYMPIIFCLQVHSGEKEGEGGGGKAIAAWELLHTTIYYQKEEKKAENYHSSLHSCSYHCVCTKSRHTAWIGIWMTKRPGAISDDGFVFKKINENREKKRKKDPLGGLWKNPFFHFYPHECGALGTLWIKFAKNYS